MGFVNKVISIYNTEPVFMETFIRELTAADNRIVCTTEDIKNNYYNIGFKINNSCYINMPRYGGNGGSAFETGYVANIKINGNQYNAYPLFSSRETWQDVGAKIIRTLNFTVASNDNTIFISIKGFSTNSGNYTGCNLYLLSVDYGTFVASSGGASINSLFTMHCTDEIHKNQSISLVNRLAYQDGGIDITNTIDSKVFVDTSSNIKFAEVTTGLMDCSYTPVENLISVGSGKFFTLNNYTLMPITEDNKGGE